MALGRYTTGYLWPFASLAERFLGKLPGQATASPTSQDIQASGITGPCSAFAVGEVAWVSDKVIWYCHERSCTFNLDET